MPLLSHTARWTARTLPRPHARASRRLLVVDDYRLGAEAVAASLSLMGYDARFVLDGPAALQTVAAWLPEIVVLDINMPGMDGFGVARRLRRDNHGQHMVIVAFTAQEEWVVRAEGLASGFDAYCQKGVALIPLMRLLESIA
jgi:CheY-like chemotaxis protein